MDFTNWAQDELKKVREQSNSSEDGINPELAKLFPPERIKRIQRKELKAYARASEKKWKHYLESMSR